MQLFFIFLVNIIDVKSRRLRWSGCNTNGGV